MFDLSNYSIRRDCRLAAVVMTAFLAGGCSWWQTDRLDIDRYRDERAIDIEQRLAREKPIVQNPF